MRSGRALRRRLGPCGVWGLLVLTAAGVARGEEGAGAPSGRLRVLTWNIHHAEGGDGKIDLERLAGVIKNSKADVVLLQEVDDRTRRTGGVAQAEELGRLTGMAATFGKAMDFQGGGYGNAVLTRATPVASEVVPLPGGGEPRCALEVTLKDQAGTGEFVVVSTHFEVSSPEARTAQASHLTERYSGRPGLVVLGGDLNATREEAAVASFASPWRNPVKPGPQTGTFPSEDPKREIDFILIKPAIGSPVPVVVDHKVIDEKVASDHRPVVMELATPAGRHAGVPFADDFHGGHPPNIPGIVQCALYDLGGEGVAYHDTTPANEGSGGLNRQTAPHNHQRAHAGEYIWHFRETESVDLSYVKDWADLNHPNPVSPPINQFYIGWTADGEWTKYTVHVTEPGTYRVMALYSYVEKEVTRDAAGRPTAEIRFDLNGTPAAVCALPRPTQGWHHWDYGPIATLTFPEAGLHTLTFHYRRGNNWAWWAFEKIEDAPKTP